MHCYKYRFNLDLNFQTQRQNVSNGLGPEAMMIKVVQRFPQYILQIKVK